MKRKPEKFTEFAADLLPHEVAWLQQVQQFQDADNGEILETLAYNCHHPRTPVTFRPGINVVAAANPSSAWSKIPVTVAVGNTAPSVASPLWP